MEMCGNGVVHPMNPEHIHLLATKWLTPSELTALAEREGLMYKKGKFSINEQNAIRSALEAYKLVSFINAVNNSLHHICSSGPLKRL